MAVRGTESQELSLVGGGSESREEDWKKGRGMEGNGTGSGQLEAMKMKVVGVREVGKSSNLLG